MQDGVNLLRHQRVDRRDVTIEGAAHGIHVQQQFCGKGWTEPPPKRLSGILDHEIGYLPGFFRTAAA